MRMIKKTEITILFIMASIAVLVSVILLIPPDPSTIDNDDDGVMNDKDVFPNNQFESMDIDGDGIGDNTDKFPNDPAASIDSDDDGHPDAWNKGKTQNDSTSL